MKKSLTIGLLMALGSCGDPATTDLKNAPNAIELGESSDLNLGMGMGFDSVREATALRCIDFDGWEALPGTERGKNISARLEVVDTYQELAKSLGISAATSLKLGFASASYSMKMTDKFARSETKLYAVAKIKVKNTPKVIKNARLTDEARALLEGGNIDAFFTRCGDQYVNAIRTGGYMYGIITIETQTSENKESMRHDIKGSAFGSSAEGGISTDLKKVLKDSHHTVEFLQTGGGGLMPVTLDGLLEKFSGFVESFTEEEGQGNSWPIEIGLQSYVGHAAGLLPRFDFDKEIQTVKNLSYDYLYFKEYEVTLEKALNSPAEFYDFDEQEAKDMLLVAKDRIEDIRKVSKACMSSDLQRQCEYQSQTRFDVGPPLMKPSGWRTAEKVLNVKFPTKTIHITPRMLKRVKGDAEFYGHGPRVTIDHYYVVEDGGLYLKFVCVMQEVKRIAYAYHPSVKTKVVNWDSRAQGEIKVLVADIPAGWKVTWIEGARYRKKEGDFKASRLLDYTDTNHQWDNHDRGWAKTSTFGDGYGDDIGRDSQTKIKIKPGEMLRYEITRG